MYSVCENSPAHSLLICVLFYIYVTFNKKFLETDLRIKKILAQWPVHTEFMKVSVARCGEASL